MTHDKFTRQRVLELYNQLGAKFVDEIATAFNISVRTIFSWVAALRDENVSEPKRYRTPKGWIAIPPLHFDYARTALEAYPLLFLLELSEVMLFHTDG